MQSGIVDGKDVVARAAAHLDALDDEARDREHGRLCRSYLAGEAYQIDEASVVGADAIAGPDEGVIRLDFPQTRQLFLERREYMSDGMQIDTLFECMPDDTTTNAFVEPVLRYLSQREHNDDDYLMDIVFDGSRSYSLITRFKAVYVFDCFHRGRKDASACKEVIDRTPEMSRYPLWHYCRSRVLADAHDWEAALRHARRCIDGCGGEQTDNPGILNSYGEIVYQWHEDTGACDGEMVDRALAYIERALSLNDRYAKYYYTKGQLLTLKGEHARARALMLRAIDLEDSGRTDYALRINDFQMGIVRSRISEALAEINMSLAELGDLRESLQIAIDRTEELQRRADGMTQELEDTKRSTLEMLGFFAGVIALVVTTSGLAQNLAPLAAIATILALTGALIMAFALFSAMLLRHGRQEWRENLGFVAFGAVLVILAMILAR